MHGRLPSATDIPGGRAGRDEPDRRGAATIRQVPLLADVNARVQPLAVAARIVMLALVAALTLIATGDPAQLGWIALLAVAAIPAVIAPDHHLFAPLGRFAE